MQHDHGFSGTGAALHNQILTQRQIQNRVLAFLYRGDNVQKLVLSPAYFEDVQKEAVPDFHTKGGAVVPLVPVSEQLFPLNVKAPPQF